MALSDHLNLIAGKTRTEAIAYLASLLDDGVGIVNKVTPAGRSYWLSEGPVGATGTAYAVLVDILRYLAGTDTATTTSMGGVQSLDAASGKIGINKPVPSVELDIVGDTTIKGILSVINAGSGVVLKVDPSYPVSGVGGDPDVGLTDTLQLIATDLVLDNAQFVRFKDSLSALQSVLGYDANNNIVLANAATGGAGSRNKAGFLVMVDSLGTAPAIVVDDQGNVGLGTPAPLGANSNVLAKLHIIGEKLLIEDANATIEFNSGVDSFLMRLDSGALVFQDGGVDVFEMNQDGIKFKTQLSSNLYGSNSLGAQFPAVKMGGTLDLRSKESPGAPSLDGSIRLITELDGVGGVYPNPIYGVIIVEGYSGCIGLWANSLPTECLQLGDAALTEQIGIKIFDGGANKPSFLELFESNNPLFLYRDTNGVLRTHSAKPGATMDEVGGTKIVSQSLLAHVDPPSAAAGPKPSDEEGMIVCQEATGSSTDRLYWKSASGAWKYVNGYDSANPELRQVTLPLRSPAGANGTFYFGGYYQHAATPSTFAAPATLGGANSPLGAHAYLVLGGATVDQITVQLSGASIDDAGTLNLADTEDIVIAHPSVLNDYFQSAKRWVGTVTFTKTAGTSVSCNYGFVACQNSMSRDFVVHGFDASWLGGAADTSLDIQVVHHVDSGWTYNAAAPATPPAALCSMLTDYTGSYNNAVSSEHGFWRRRGLAQLVKGSGIEGIFVKIVTTVNAAIEGGQIVFDIEV